MKKRGAAKKPVWKSPRGILAGKIEITGDIVNFDTWLRTRFPAGPAG